MDKVDCRALLQRNEKLKRQKETWYPLYQALAQFVLLRKQYFTSEHTDGPFLLNKVYDSAAMHSAQLMAQSVLGQIWPNPFESFEFVPQVAQDEEVFTDAFDMMNTVNEVMPANLAAYEAGVMTTLSEVLLDLVIFGTAAMAVIETGDMRTPIVTKAIDAKSMAFAENDQGQVDTVYMEKIYTVAQMIQRFGYDACSDVVKTHYDKKDGAGLDEKIKVLHVIEPRRERNPLNLGTLDMPFASIHIEVETQHCLSESGFNEMPILVVRFWKTVGEVQGRSPAMNALADIRALNKLVELFEKAGEMGLNPPKMVATEDVLGSGKMPWGPGVNIPVHATSRAGSDRRPIEPIVTVTNPGWAIQRITELRNSIMQHFMLDRLSDLNNTSRQTLGEADIRNELRQFMVGPLLIRILVELIGPFLDRSFNILLSMGAFGVIEGSQQDMLLQMQGIQPKYISQDFMKGRMSGLKGYRINFISPAARLMKLEESQGLDKTIDFVERLAQFFPGALKNVNADEVVRRYAKLSGSSQKILYPPGKVEQMRAEDAQQAQQMQQMQQAQVGAMAFKDAAKGVKDIGSAAAGQPG